MGDAAVFALMKDVSGRLTSVRLLWGLMDAENMWRTLSHDSDKIRTLLVDAEEHHIKDGKVDPWLKSMRSTYLMIEHVLDEISTEPLLQYLQTKRGIGYKVRAFFSYEHNPLGFRVSIFHKAKLIRRKMDAIHASGVELSLIPYGASSHIDDYMDLLRQMPHEGISSRIHDSSIVVGRDDDIEKVLNTICNSNNDYGLGSTSNENDHHKILVYFIYGFGGVGKTTLAQLVYSHQRVDEYFELKCWARVPKNAQLKEIMQTLIASIDNCECTLTHLHVLQEFLQDKLRGKKCLIVLVNVWITDDVKWDLLSETLSCGAKGSTVLITSRLLGQKSFRVSNTKHELKVIKSSASWNLFEKFAFAEGREWEHYSIHDELKRIGRKLVERCFGLPLEVKVLGSLMWPKRSITDWELFEESSIWRESAKHRWGYGVFQMSYDSLPPHIKRCFNYCCLFPEGYPIEKYVVIQLWIVNDFIPHRARDKDDLYMLGEIIFNLLVWRSFFYIVRDTKYSIHGIMYQMALEWIGDDCFLINQPRDNKQTNIEFPNESLHLSSSYPDTQFSPKDLGEPTSLRSILMFGEAYKLNNISQIFNHVHLQVLYLCGIGLKTLPESICKLRHLKYLNLAYSSIQVLPESIICLHNLQVLLLNCCYQLSKLPDDLRYMRSLQVLDITSCYSLIHFPVGIKEFIRHLRRLQRFHAGKKTTRVQIREMWDLDGLEEEEELEISGLENVEDLREVERANLKDKRHLRVLKLSWSNIYMRERKLEMLEYDKEVLEGLEPHENIKKLSIYFYMGRKISPSWMVKLENLDEIAFSGCKRCESIPALGKLPNLKVIKLLGMDSLEGFNDEDISTPEYITEEYILHDHRHPLFPHLRELYIFMCPSLVSLPRNLRNLEILKIQECGTLTYLPYEIQRVKQLEISGCKHLSSEYRNFIDR